MKRTLFNSEHEMFRDSFRRFVEKEIVPNNDHWEKEGQVDRDLWLKLGREGFLGMSAPEELGGAEQDDFRFNTVISEELQRVGAASLSSGIGLHNDICLPYYLVYATEEQKARWVPGICSGEAVTAIAMTEPNTGSDLASIRTNARREGDTYILNGQKTFITNGILSDLVIVVAKTSADPALRHKAISLLVVERGMKGFSRGRRLEKVGLHAQDTAELIFEDVEVPVTNRLGEEGQGFYYLMRQLAQERMSVAISAVAACWRALNLTVDY